MSIYGTYVNFTDPSDGSASEKSFGTEGSTDLPTNTNWPTLVPPATGPNRVKYLIGAAVLIAMMCIGGVTYGIINADKCSTTMCGEQNSCFCLTSQEFANYTNGTFACAPCKNKPDIKP